MRSKAATSRFCLLCHKEIGLESWLDVFGTDPLCGRCFRSFRPDMKEGTVEGYKGLSLYVYDEAFKGALYSFKGCGDYALKDVFITHQREYLARRYKGWVLVPAASVALHDEARGFNHVTEIFSCLGLPMEQCLLKTAKRKQSDLSLAERAKIGSFLRLKEGTDLRGKKILFVDDLLTSGHTALASMKLLEGAGAKKVSYLVLARVPSPKDKRKASLRDIFHRFYERIGKVLGRNPAD